MLTIPAEFALVIIPLESLFSAPVWTHARVLLVGALLAPGQRTVASVLRVLGLGGEAHFQNYHRVLNRARWSGRAASRIVLHLLIAAFAPRGPLVLGLDDTLERRWGPKIRARGIYHDPVRSSRGHFVKASGLRWLSLMLLAPVPWAGRVLALPFMTVLAPSERYHQACGRRHKKLTDWARQMLFQVRRWLPNRELIVAADSSFAALNLLAALSRCAQPIHCVTRLRLDAALYQPPPPQQTQKGRPRKKGERLPRLDHVLNDPQAHWQTVTVLGWYGQSERTLEIVTNTAIWYHPGQPTVALRWVLVRDPTHELKPQAFLCTQLEAKPADILNWFARRWQVEVTFQETRAHLGVETQRQFSDNAIARTTPALLALYSLVVLIAHHQSQSNTLLIRTTAWYKKSQPTFSDAIASVRRSLWRALNNSTSPFGTETMKIPKALFEQLTETLCYAA